MAPDLIVIVLDVEDPFVSMIRTDIVDFIDTILLAANKTF